MADPLHRHGHPVSVKGVLFVGGQVLLLRNDREEWELPGGRPDPGESWPQALDREIREETALSVEVDVKLREWPYEVLPGRFVWIVAFGCRVADAAVPSISAEHDAWCLAATGDLAGLHLHEGYRAAIDAWAAIVRSGA
jgi:ADP-ribose pyrophosphatase YjhB (NUDIX family)